MDRRLPSLVVLLCVIAGCSSLEPRPVVQIAGGLPLEPLQLSIHPEYYFLRLDLVRSSHSETFVLNPQTGAMLVNEVVDPYHVVGIGLGNGLVYDLNKNLYLDLGAMLGVADGRDFSIVKKKPRVSYVRSGGEFKRTVGSPVPLTDAVVTFEGKKVRVRQPMLDSVGQSLLRTHQHNLWHSNCDVTVEDDGLSYEPRGLLALAKTKLVRDEDGTIRVPGALSDRTFKIEGNKILLDGQIQVTCDDNRIEIERRGLFGTEHALTLTRTEDGFCFDGDESTGVRMTGTGVELYGKGAVVATYERQSSSPDAPDADP